MKSTYIRCKIHSFPISDWTYIQKNCQTRKESNYSNKNKRTTVTEL